MIRKLTEKEKSRLHFKIVKKYFDRLIVIPNFSDFEDADRRGETLEYEYFEEYVRSIEHFYLSNYSEKPMIVRAFREATGRHDIGWKEVRQYYKVVGGNVFWGWSKERYFEEYPKARELKNVDKILIETKYGLVRIKCDDFENFPGPMRTKTEDWETNGKKYMRNKEVDTF